MMSEEKEIAEVEEFLPCKDCGKLPEFTYRKEMGDIGIEWYFINVKCQEPCQNEIDRCLSRKDLIFDFGCPFSRSVRGPQKTLEEDLRIITDFIDPTLAAISLWNFLMEDHDE
jgi:hypothetical protein